MVRSPSFLITILKKCHLRGNFFETNVQHRLKGFSRTHTDEKLREYTKKYRMEQNEIRIPIHVKAKQRPPIQPAAKMDSDSTALKSSINQIGKNNLFFQKKLRIHFSVVHGASSKKDDTRL